MSVRERYVLATGAAGAPRLALLHSVMGPRTEAALRSAGIAPGMHVADIGCGTGHVTRLLSQLVGASGQVTGIDASQDQLTVAADTCSDLANVTLATGDAYETHMPRACFDLVYCRFVLCHLARPQDALQEFVALLRPGGTVLCEDQEASTLQSVPETAAYQDAARMAVAIGIARNADAEIGPKLPALLRAAGLTDLGVSVVQDGYFQGEEKRLYEWTMAERNPQAIERGLASRSALESNLAAVRAVNDDESVLVLLPRIWQVWGRKR